MKKNHDALTGSATCKRPGIRFPASFTSRSEKPVTALLCQTTMTCVLGRSVASWDGDRERPRTPLQDVRCDGASGTLARVPGRSERPETGWRVPGQFGRPGTVWEAFRTGEASPGPVLKPLSCLPGSAVLLPPSTSPLLEEACGPPFKSDLPAAPASAQGCLVHRDSHFSSAYIAASAASAFHPTPSSL